MQYSLSTFSVTLFIDLTISMYSKEIKSQILPRPTPVWENSHTVLESHKFSKWFTDCYGEVWRQLSTTTFSNCLLPISNENFLLKITIKSVSRLCEKVRDVPTPWSRRTDGVCWEQKKMNHYHSHNTYIPIMYNGAFLQACMKYSAIGL